MDKNLAHYITVTVVPINKEGKFLICKRAEWEKAFPGKWTVPGGKMEVLDYALRNKDTIHHWYNVFEEIAKKETKEETNLEIEEIGYITSMVYIRSDKIPCVIVSLYAKCKNEPVILDKCLTESAWITIEEANNFDLIEGIHEELKMLDIKLKKGKNILWSKEL
jgi:ADP-ribose pyrophosphatase YjhB (NUDIX family)